MTMKKNLIILLMSLLTLTFFTACEDMLDVKSEQYIFDEDYRMKNTNDTLYSMFGVFSKLQKLADNYVILGELRGDLMTTGENSGKYLQQIHNFAIQPGNPYASVERDFYAVINNCNYIIQNIDTSVVNNSVKVMYKEYAACKSIRAWAYLQLMLDFGHVYYYTQPILTVQEAANPPQEFNSVSELAPVLIADIEQWKNTENPSTGYMDIYNTDKSYFPISFVIGDLYLWNGQYEQAAQAYHDLMVRKGIVINNNYRTIYEVVNNEFTGNYQAAQNYSYWYNWLTNTPSNEVVTSIMASNQYKKNFILDSLTTYPYQELLPSQVALDNWDNQIYTHAYFRNSAKEYEMLSKKGDLRTRGSLYSVLSLVNGQIVEGDRLIEKYNYLNPINYDNKQIVVYRAALLYLRYAEAVNRLGKPNLALAVLKNGLSSTSMVQNVPAFEKDSVLPEYMDFSDTRFSQSMGVRSRGCGNVGIDTTYYKIPDFTSSTTAKSDTIEYVEDLIVQELALETAFEGNRFQDLMRVAIRRNKPGYLAEKVAAKFAADSASMYQKLIIKSNWYLK